MNTIANGLRLELVSNKDPLGDVGNVGVRLLLHNLCQHCNNSIGQGALLLPCVSLYFDDEGGIGVCNRSRNEGHFSLQ